MMRTPKQPWETDIHIIRPIFWTKCEKCGNEFRFEKMYRHIDMRYVGGRHKYGCMNCFEDRLDFWKFVTYIPKPPSPPGCENKRKAYQTVPFSYRDREEDWVVEKVIESCSKGGEKNDKDRHDNNSASGT